MSRCLLPLVAGVSLLASGCASVERSRDLADASVPPAAVAKQVCAMCHGVDGNPVSPQFPRLAGQPAAYLAGELRAFRSHTRSDGPARDYMWGLTRQLSDTTIDGLALYYSKQVPAPAVVATTAPVERAEALFRDGDPARGVPSCASCHGEHGEGHEQIPRIAGQQAHYIQHQLTLMRSGQREAPVMRTVLGGMDDQQIETLAAYLAARR